MDYNTYFYDEKEQRVGSFPGLVPLTIGMVFKINGASYIVDSLQFNLDNHDGNEELGLQAFCKTNSKEF